MDGYVDDRLYGPSVGTVCEGCKVLAAPFAGNLIRHLEGESRVEDAADQRAKSRSFSRRTQSMITLPRAVSITSLAIALSFFSKDLDRAAISLQCVVNDDSLLGLSEALAWCVGLADVPYHAGRLDTSRS